MGLSQPAFLGALLWASGILADIATRPSLRRWLVQEYARGLCGPRSGIASCGAG
jgi:hypothetical protein